ncbi:MAG: SDR family oxidoreductase [Burkholderiaceae bacterium]|jgi:NAD(P)-dependent dehydrogenase (short-subunit alcohol dehydrogenase family)
MQSFQGKTAVLTGAGSGFGLACAHRAAALGMNLVLIDVQADALSAAAAALSPTGVAVMTAVTDVADAAAMDALANDVMARFGAPHLVFNNAGVGTSGLLWEATTAEWDWVMGVNVWGVIHGVRVFTPRMLEAAKGDPTYQGHIVNTASMAGLLTPPNMGVYNVSKHAVVALTESLYQDLCLVTDQVSASVLCPYFVPTGISQSGRNQPKAVADTELTASKKIGQAMLDKAVQSGKVSAQTVAELVFDAVRDNQFYIYSHPQALSAVETRLKAIVNQTQPPDPFAERPQIGENLKQALRGG